MAVGSDAKIFGKDKSTTNKNPRGGRPKIDRDLALRLFQAKYSPAVVAGHLDCKEETAQAIRRELVKAGKLDKIKTQAQLVSADFDEECKRATGFSFRDWLINKRKKDNAIYTFNFCEKVWRNIWDRPSLFIASEKTENLGDVLAQQFLNVFGEDKKRIRGRKKLIRQLFIFLGRTDVNDRHFSMTSSRDPRSVRRVPEISMLDFPTQLDAALNEMETSYGLKAATWLRVKICTGIRTGDRSEGRGLKGLSTDNQTPSYIFFRGSNWRAQAFEKRGETWPITWIPPSVLAGLKTLYEEALKTESKFIFRFTRTEYTEISRAWKIISKKHTGIELEFHDMRKVSITWLFAMNIPLEIATSINVGWKDLSTARDHYLDLRSFLKKSARLAYQANIPEWYKPGLEEYAREE